jgi:hypothetical protein
VAPPGIPGLVANTVAEAEEACKDLAPERDGGSTKDQAAALERALAYSQ